MKGIFLGPPGFSEPDEAKREALRAQRYRGSGRAKLRLSRGFPGCPARNVTPQTAISRSFEQFEPTALSRWRTQIRDGWASLSRPMGTGQVLVHPLADLPEAKSNSQTSSVGDRSKGTSCVRPDIRWGQVTVLGVIVTYQSVDSCPGHVG
jgi:hypothetical protein